MLLRQYASAVICRRTLEKIQFSLGNCRLPRRISKAVSSCPLSHARVCSSNPPVVSSISDP